MEAIFGNGSLATSTTWKPEPITRGTYTILSTCLITLGLCVWTAVHLNIPGRYERRMDVTPHEKWKFWAFWVLITCLWPHKYLGWPAQTLRKVGWTILGFLTPEVVAFTAYRQYKEALSLTQKLQQTFSMAPDIENGRTVPRNQWTLTHGFFVVMGGVEVALDDQANNVFPQRWVRGEARNSLVLTPTGFRLLVERHPHLVQDLSLQMIRDKSKGGVFAKTLVCIQALWFCVQCLTRLGEHLGISLLELNTFGHAVCALGIYVLWWHKPLDIQEPVTIHIPLGPEAETLSIMCMTSILDEREPEISSVYPRLVHASSDRDPPNLHLGVSSFITSISVRRDHGYQPDLDFGRLPWHLRGAVPSDIAESPSPSPPLRIESLPHFRDSNPVPDRWKIDLVIPLPLRDQSDGETQLQSFSFRPPLSAIPIPNPSISKTSNPKPNTFGDSYTIKIPHDSLLRYALAATHVDEWTELSDPDHSNPRYRPRPGYQDSLADRIPNLPRFQPIRTDWMFYLGFGAVGFLYGGLHCLAWNAPFNTRAEQTLWRISSIALTATAILLVHLYTWELSRPVIGFGQKLGNLGKNLRRFHQGFLYKHLPDWVYSQPPPGEQMREFRYLQKWDATALVVLPLLALVTIFRVVYDLLVCSFIVLYIAARVFLVVECFINLTHLPESAYLLPQWSQYVPHIG